MGGAIRSAISKIAEDQRRQRRSKRSILGSDGEQKSNVMRKVARNPVTAEQMRRLSAKEWVKNIDPSSPAQVAAADRLRKKYGF